MEGFVVRLFKVDIRTSDYEYYDDYVKRRAKAAKLAEVLPSLTLLPLLERPEGENEDGTGDRKYMSRSFLEVDGGGDSIWVTDDEYLTLLDIDKDIKVTQIAKKIVDMGEAFKAVDGKSGMLVQREGNQYNQKCEVHMPGQALSTYNEVMLMEDCCSDALQSELVRGWRIIAACPQPDQRRPDYILGRFNADTHANHGADRG